MTLIVENGTIVANANTYIDRAYYIAYAASRGVAIAEADAADVEIIGGMDYVEIQNFKGDLVASGYPEDYMGAVPIEPEQPCQWPRKGLYRGDDQPGAVYFIPENLKRAQAQVALDIHNGFSPLANTAAGARLLSEKIGPLSRQYSQELRTFPLMPLANGLLKPLLRTSAIFGATVYRA